MSMVRRYGFINAKLRARIGMMFTEKEFDSFLRAGSLEEFLQQLQGTPYANLIAIYNQSGDIQQVEAALFEREVALHREVATLLKGRHRHLIETLTRKLEVENLKSVVRLWYSNTVKGQNIASRYGYLYQGIVVDPIEWSRIVNASNWEEVVQALGSTIYQQPVAQFESEQLSEEGLFYLEIALDRLRFQELYQILKRLPVKDRHVLRSVLEVDVDLKNIINLVRYGYLYQLSPERLHEVMLEGGSVIDSPEFKQFLATAPEERSITPLLEARFPQLAADLLAGGSSSSSLLKQIVKVEQHLASSRKKKYLSMLRGYPFTIGTVLAYFFLCDRQDTMIRAIINGLYYGWDDQTIRGYAL